MVIYTYVLGIRKVKNSTMSIIRNPKVIKLEYNERLILDPQEENFP